MQKSPISVMFHSLVDLKKILFYLDVLYQEMYYFYSWKDVSNLAA